MANRKSQRLARSRRLLDYLSGVERKSVDYFAPQSVGRTRAARSPGRRATKDDAQTRAYEHRQAIDRSNVPNDILFSAESIINELRPAIEINGGKYKRVRDAEWEDFNNDDLKALVARVAQATGCISRRQGEGVVGTGFIAGPNLIVTNRHVAAELGGLDSNRQFIWNSNTEAGINFLNERNRRRDDSSWFKFTRNVLFHPYFDIAIFEVASLSGDRKPLALSAAPFDANSRSDAFLLGYPTADTGDDEEAQSRLLDGNPGIKRLQPGYLSAPKDILVGGRQLTAIPHDSSTLGGSSGSPVVTIDGKVVGVHFHGRLNDMNWAIPTAELVRDPRVTATGLLVEGASVAAAGGQGPWTAWWSKFDSGQLI